MITPEQFAKMREESKTKIMDAATRVFIKNGFDGTSIKMIAQECGISVGLMYRYFKNKEDLFLEIVDNLLEEFLKTKRLFESNANPKDILINFAKEMLESLSDELMVGVIMLIAKNILSKNKLIYQKTMERELEVLTALSKLIERGQKEGQFVSGNSLDLAKYLFMQIQGIAIFNSVEPLKFHSINPEQLIAYLLK
ncbi:MAG TPA: TetR/AcrR family transcriptional regulator [Acholeplasmataceae bacterium]|jgi:AcrR family transcriptional regulator|nr:TetR/AcrR family transcriptional regulator [Acholeplasmataceae bacterium]